MKVSCTLQLPVIFCLGVHAGQGSVTDDEVVAFLESHAHRCQTKGPALRRKLQELQQLQQELPNVGQNKRTRR